MFVLDAHWAGDVGAAEEGEDLGDAADSGAIGHIVAVALKEVEILEVSADDTAAQGLQGLNGLNAASHPVAGVGAGADANVAVLHQVVDKFGVPNLVVRVVGLDRVVVVSDLQVELLHHFLHHVDGLHAFGVDDLDAHGLGPGKELAGVGFVGRDAGDAEAQGVNALGGQLGLQRGGLFGAHVGADAGVIARGQLLAGIELDVLDARHAGLFDGLKGGEAVERPGLNAQVHASDHAVLNRGRGGGDDSKREQRGQHVSSLDDGCLGWLHNSDKARLPLHLALGQKVILHLSGGDGLGDRLDSDMHHLRMGQALLSVHQHPPPAALRVFGVLGVKADEDAIGGHFQRLSP